MIKRNNKSIIQTNSVNVDTPCRECAHGGVESNYMIFCPILKHCVVASNKKCKTGLFKKR